jgi:hypothetical protein
MRQWIDGRFKWLEDELGEDVPRTARVILPTPEFFPDIYEGRPDDAVAMLSRVAGYMGVNRDRFKLAIYNNHGELAGGLHVNHSGTSAAGIYTSDSSLDREGRPRALIGVDAANLSDPMRLVAIFAHEIGHEILLGEGRVSREQQDHEPLTDLLTVFKGLGIFNSNSTIRDQALSSGTMVGWRTQSLGYLNQRCFGYALARFAWVRTAPKRAWMKRVRPDVRKALKEGLRFIASQETIER